jgi:predicted DNA-binding protein
MQRLNPNEQKPVQVNFVLSSDLKQKLAILAKQSGQSAYIRSLIERAWAEQQGE